jgi:hypothetical protein
MTEPCDEWLPADYEPPLEMPENIAGLHLAGDRVFVSLEGGQMVDITSVFNASKRTTQ